MAEQNPTNKPIDTSHRTKQTVRLPGNEIIAAHNAITPLTGTNKQLPEYLFVEGFLRMFAGYDTHPDMTIGRWVSIAGTPFSEVDIINQNGEVIFTVPPIYERRVLTPEHRSNGNSITAITDTYEKLSHQSPYRAQAFLDSQLDQINKTANMEAYRGIGAKRFKEIFQRYDLTPAWELESESAPQSTGGSQTQEQKKQVVDEEPL